MPDFLTISLQELPDTEALERARDDVQETLAESGSRLARMKWPMLRDAASRCMRAKLGELDPLTILANAWGSAIEIRELAAKTRALPGEHEFYPLGDHNLSAKVHLIVKLHCGPVAFPALTFTLCLEGLVECAILDLFDGRLVALEGLRMTPSASLSYGSTEIKRIEGQPQEWATFALPNGGLEIAGFPETPRGETVVDRGVANRSSWNALPMPAQREPLDLQLVFSVTDGERLRRGHIPRSMDDKWFIFFEDGWLFFHRSWSGHCIFALKLAEQPGGLRVEEAWVNADPDQYNSQDPDADKRMIEQLIANRLLH